MEKGISTQKIAKFRHRLWQFLKNHVEVEVALRDFHKPIGVAEYKMIFPENEIKSLINRELNLK